jgi:hypothetical protein
METQQAQIDHLGTPSLVETTPDSLPFKIRQIPVGFIDETVLGMVEEVVDKSGGRFTAESIVHAINEDQMQLWVVYRGYETARAIVGTSLQQELSGDSTAMVHFVWGKGMDEWKHLLDEIREWGRFHGCNRLAMWARKGFAKKLPELAMTHVLLEENL